MKNTVVILAGGKGERAGFGIPKQFVPLLGRTMIERTVDTFEQHPLISHIVIVTAGECAEEMKRTVMRNSWHKLLGIAMGGATRFASANAGLLLCPPGEGNVLIHDGARPLADAPLITALCRSLDTHEAAVTAVPSTDSLLLSDGERVEGYLDRTKVWRVQTPQGFRTELLRSAYLEALRHSDFSATDDASLLRKYFPDVSIAIVRGSEDNIKLTYSRDKELIEQIISRRTKIH